MPKSEWLKVGDRVTSDGATGVVTFVDPTNGNVLVKWDDAHADTTEVPSELDDLP